MVYKYKTSGTCSRSITVELNDGVIKGVRFEGGCSGNTQGIEALVRGMDAGRVIDMFKDIKCGDRDTSCPAQLAIALSQALDRDGAVRESESREVRV